MTHDRVLNLNRKLIKLTQKPTFQKLIRHREFYVILCFETELISFIVKRTPADVSDPMLMAANFNTQQSLSQLS